MDERLVVALLAGAIVIVLLLAYLIDRVRQLARTVERIEILIKKKHG